FSSASAASGSSLGCSFLAGSSSATGAFASPPPTPPITASSAAPSPVSSAWTLIDWSTPATGEGTSVSTLSVDTSNSGSSASTWSPSCFSQRVIVASGSDLPRSGMVTVGGFPSPEAPALGRCLLALLLAAGLLAALLGLGGLLGRLLPVPGLLRRLLLGSLGLA